MVLMKYTVTKEPMAMLEIELARDEQITAEAGSMVYMKGDIEIKTRTQKGGVFLNAYGGVVQKELLAGEKIIIDNYHLVAFSENMSYRVTKFGGLKTTILGGEGLVTEITGPGTAYFQTKNLRQLALALSRYIPKSSSSSVSFGS